MSVKVLLLTEQHYPGIFTHIGARCVWCGLPGGNGPPPSNLTPDERAAWRPLDMHEWLIKRNSNIPDEIIFCSLNMVLLHNKCHIEYGQTKEMTKRIWRWKVSQGYDPLTWLTQLAEAGHYSIRSFINYDENTN
jgi:hypothetical protein